MTNKYTTLSEASEASITLNITSVTEYRKRYKEDPKLPAAPYIINKSNWVSWYDFLGKDEPY